MIAVVAEFAVAAAVAACNHGSGYCTFFVVAAGVEVVAAVVVAALVYAEKGPWDAGIEVGYIANYFPFASTSGPWQGRLEYSREKAQNYNHIHFVRSRDIKAERKTMR